AFGIGPHGHALHPAGIRKVVDIGRAEIGRDGRVDVGKGHAECIRLTRSDQFPPLEDSMKLSLAIAVSTLFISGAAHASVAPGFGGLSSWRRVSLKHFLWHACR